MSQQAFTEPPVFVLHVSSLDFSLDYSGVVGAG
jgi:hypothetical protein